MNFRHGMVVVLNEDNFSLTFDGNWFANQNDKQLKMTDRLCTLLMKLCFVGLAANKLNSALCYFGGGKSNPIGINRVTLVLQ